MNILLCDLFWTDVFPDLWWGLVVIVTILGALGIVRPLIQSHIASKSSILDKQFRHEETMKADAFKREKEWYSIKKTERILDIELKLKECQEDLEKLKKKEEELDKGIDSFKEKIQLEKEILQTKITTYEKILKTINK